MPLPALFGLAALASYIYGLLAAAMAFVVEYLTVRTAIRLIFIGLVVASIYSSFQAIDALVDTIATSAPSFIAVPLSWVLPSNFSACVSVIVSAHITIIAMRFYIWTMSLLAS